MENRILNLGIMAHVDAGKTTLTERDVYKRQDKNRIYGTGQSMGCMMLCELNIRYPGFFGGCFLVAGQWNPVSYTHIDVYKRQIQKATRLPPVTSSSALTVHSPQKTTVSWK